MAEGWISPTPPSLDHGAGEDRSRSLSGFEFYACANANGSIALGVHMWGAERQKAEGIPCVLWKIMTGTPSKLHNSLPHPALQLSTLY